MNDTNTKPEYTELFEDVVRKAYGMPPLTESQRREAIARNEQFRRDMEELRRKQRTAGSNLRNLILD